MQKLRSFTVMAALAVAAAAESKSPDFGAYRDGLLEAQCNKYFGVAHPIDDSSTASISAADAEANPTLLATLASPLTAKVVNQAANAAPNFDMMALWPTDETATHIIACNEEGSSAPGVQRIRLSDGLVETILTGTNSCDPVRRTAWGTIVVGEENGSSGQIIEIINPLATTGVLWDDAAGTSSGGTGASNVVSRRALGRLSFEGLALLPNGVLYYGDENRPLNGVPAGAFFKFIPDVPYTGTTPITSLEQSPLTSGRIFGLRLGKRSGNTDYGQGTETGLGTWIEIASPFNANLRAQAATLKLTGYYRPEDAEIDPAELAKGRVRFCGTWTGNESQDKLWGGALCLTDGTFEQATANTATPEVQDFVIGTPELAMIDNLAFQPGRQNWIFHEDGDGPEVGRNNDLWACLPDGADDDRLSDACVRIATLNDLNAEWTGGFFDSTGKHFYVSVQHNVTGHGVILDITGWK